MVPPKVSKGRLEKMKEHITEQTAIFVSVAKWILISSVVGIIIGSVVTLFLKLLLLAEAKRTQLPIEHYYLLPFALFLTVWLVRTFAPMAKGHGTEKVIEAVHKANGKISVRVIPIKLFATILTIFSGGSVGKEGPGAQIGAGTASLISDLFRFNDADRKKLAICGISAGFATVFGTPIAGAIFGVEVLIIGVILYDVLLPSFIAGFAAFTTAQLLGIHYTYYDLRFYENVSLNLPLIFMVAASGLFFGFVSDMFSTIVSRIEAMIRHIKLHVYAKAFIAGYLLIAMAEIFGTEYLGLGIENIKDMLNPDPYFAKDLPWYAFMLKTLFTAVTLGAGGSGGIITPIFFVGAASGHAFGTIMGDHIALFAALGFVSVLAGTTNSPIAATIMAVELFGIEIAHYAAISAVISFLITGHRSVFPSQILAMKKSEILDVNTGKDIEHTSVALDDIRVKRFKRFQARFHRHKRPPKPPLK